MRQEITKQEENVTDLSIVNKELLDYIEALKTKQAAQTCTEKKKYTGGAKPKGQKTSPLKDKIQCALWFSESLVLNCPR